MLTIAEVGKVGQIEWELTRNGRLQCFKSPDNIIKLAA